MGEYDDIMGELRTIKDFVSKTAYSQAEIHRKLDLLLKQQHESVLWETKGKDLRVKGSMKDEPTEMGCTLNGKD